MHTRNIDPNHGSMRACDSCIYIFSFIGEGGYGAVSKVEKEEEALASG